MVKYCLPAILIVAFSTLSCNKDKKDYFSESGDAICENSQFDNLTTRTAENTTVLIDAPYVFMAQKDVKAFTDIVTLEDRFAACEVPENTLKATTTDALVRTALNYPLNFIYSAYSDPFYAVDLILKNSSLHRELISRRDAAEVLLQHFGLTYIDMENTKSVFNRDGSALTYVNEMFFEYLLAAGNIPGLDTKENKELLKSIARKKLIARLAAPETFSEASLVPLLLLANEPANEGGVRSGSWNWDTPLGHSLSVSIREEFTSTEIVNMILYYTSYYPNATMHNVPSNTYNANGFVWIKHDPTDAMASNNPFAWLENSGGNGNQLTTTLLTQDFYEGTSTASEGIKIYYPSIDYSAEPYESGLILSKWGTGPVMEHAPAYCPYSLSSPSYYRVRTTPLIGPYTIYGPETVAMNVSNFYSVQPNSTTYRGIDSYNWIVEAYSGIASSFYWDDETHLLICYQPGAYRIRVQGIFNNSVITIEEKTVVCLP